MPLSPLGVGTVNVIAVSLQLFAVERRALERGPPTGVSFDEEHVVLVGIGLRGAEVGAVDGDLLTGSRAGRNQ
jgi:hypothetical protein